jgi:hypothetical protein
VETTQYEILERKKEILELLSAHQHRLTAESGTYLYCGEDGSRFPNYLGFECEPRHTEQPISSAGDSPSYSLDTLR